MNRREFLEFLGSSSVSLALTSNLAGCVSPRHTNLEAHELSQPPFPPLSPSSRDDLQLADGFHSHVVIRWDDPLNNKGLKFGFNNDFLAFFPLTQGEALLWANHEYMDPLFVSGYSKGVPRTKKQVSQEMKAVGGSVVHLRQEQGRWTVVENSHLNRRLDAFTKIPFAVSAILGKREAIGTLAGCGGGTTPWNTVLSCEENYHDFFGENVLVNGKRQFVPGEFRWHEFYHHPPEHYGWVVEVNPLNGEAKKLPALGRFSHESAAVTVASDGRCVIYMGDDKARECVYKFISAKSGSLDRGELFVANLEHGEWRSLAWDKSSILQKMFTSPAEALVHTREAARAIGGSPLDRPEDIEIHPHTRAVFVALSNNRKASNHMGSILKIEEDDANPLSLKFKSSVYFTGGEETGVACPDNLVFDSRGNLWMTNDISDDALNKPPYTSFGNNSLFFIPTSGPQAGKALRVANAPVSAEFTGPTFSSDFRTLFLSVQHPGEGTTDVQNPLSHWPDGGSTTPRPSVVAISGPALDAIVGR